MHIPLLNVKTFSLSQATTRHSDVHRQYPVTAGSLLIMQSRKPVRQLTWVAVDEGKGDVTAKKLYNARLLAGG